MAPVAEECMYSLYHPARPHMDMGLPVTNPSARLFNIYTSTGPEAKRVRSVSAVRTDVYYITGQ